MSSRMEVQYEGKHSYDILFETDFAKLKGEIDSLGFQGRRICIVTDRNVEPLYAGEVQNAISDDDNQVIVYTLPDGEENKNLDEIRKLYAFLIENKFDRHDLLIALGGGVVGDMTGFCAATYLRGIDFIQIPTTLLAQTDSSIGGKTGVDFDGYKNMVGAFHMPRLVYMNFSVLNTLSDRQFASGFAEIMKHGLIKDGEFYVWLLDHMYEITDRDLDTLKEMVQHSCNIKREVVEKDPKEKGDRALLNFGHTIGHAVEKAKNFQLLHGECVALGCVAASFISWKKELLDMDDYYEIRDMFVPFNLPISVTDIDPSEILELMHSDKKADHGSIKFILLKSVGKAVVSTDVTDEEILAAIHEILYVEDGE